jgi:hypothetical protein
LKSTYKRHFNISKIDALDFDEKNVAPREDSDGMAIGQKK